MDMDGDADLIARVYLIKDPKNELHYAFNTIEGSRHWVAPIQPTQPSLLRPSPLPYDSREPTPLLDPTELVQARKDESPYLELRFSCVPRTSHGFLFGRNPRCDVVLPNRPGPSHYHFAVTFDDCRRLVVIDLHSTTGTQVTYNREGQGFRRGHRWIVGGDKDADGSDITVSIAPGEFQFRIVANISEAVMASRSGSAVYNRLVDVYRTGAADASSLFEDLNLRIQQKTELPSGAQTPGTETGNMDVAAWENEAHIMRLTSQHRPPNIVQFLDSAFDPYPQLLFEFVPGGSLEEHINLSAVERHMVLCQCLSALVHLHESDPPIVHRDIKPGNILVSSRCEGRIYIKLSDFGMSRDYNDMSTICGTPKYLAPEIWASDEYAKAGGGERQSYNEGVDVWSLGVVMMLVMEPSERDSARVCLEHALELTPDGDGNADVRDGGSSVPARSCRAEAHDPDAELTGPDVYDARRRDDSDADANAGVEDDTDAETIILGRQKQPRRQQQQQQQQRQQQPPQQQDVSGGASDSSFALSSTDICGAKTQILARRRPRDTRQRFAQQRRARQASLANRNVILAEEAQRPPEQGGGQGEGEGGGQTLAQQESTVLQPLWSPSFSGGNEEQLTGAGLAAAAPETEMHVVRTRGHSTPGATAASHKSTRSLFFDKPGLVRMVLRRQQVTMQASEPYHLNASQLILAGNVSAAAKATLLRTLKRRGVLHWQAAGQRKAAWVPFRDGVFLCQLLGVDDALQPLLLHAQTPLPGREENHLMRLAGLMEHEFTYLPWKGGQCRVPCRPRDRLINMTTLLMPPTEFGLRNGPKRPTAVERRLETYLKRNPQMKKMVLGSGKAEIRGTYVSYEDAEVIYDHFDGQDGQELTALLRGDTLQPSAIAAAAAVIPSASSASSVPQMADTTQAASASSAPPSQLAYVVPSTLQLAGATETQTVKVRPRRPPQQQVGVLTAGDDDSASYFTEADYQHGSYLAQANSSHLHIAATTPRAGAAGGDVSTHGGSGYAAGVVDVTELALMPGVLIE